MFKEALILEYFKFQTYLNFYERTVKFDTYDIL